MRNLIAISGKINSGKDTVGKIIQILTNYPDMSIERVLEHLDKQMYNNKYEIIKIADALKDCVCRLINCTREQLEDREFKETPLGPEWNFWRLRLVCHNQVGHWPEVGKLFLSLEEAHEHFTRPKGEWGSNAGTRFWTDDAYEEVQMTPRLMLQLLGTEAGRRIIHPNIWVNATFAKYTKSTVASRSFHRLELISEEGDDITFSEQYPKWIITDLRFPNEMEAINLRRGLTIRVSRTDRHIIESTGGKLDAPVGFDNRTHLHESETALDNHIFDYVIDNDGSLSDLVVKTKTILKLEKVI